MVGNSSSILFRYSVEGSLATDRQRIHILLILGILKRILPEQILYQGRLLVDPPLDSITPTATIDSILSAAYGSLPYIIESV